MTLTGYRRSDGRVGFRNHLVILPTSVCASEAAVRIAGEVPGAVALPHQHGCCQMGDDYRQTLRTLVGLAANPNVGAAIVVGLGCEGIQAESVREELEAAGTRVAGLVIQEHGGTRRTVAEGVRLATEMAAELARTERVPCEVSDIVLGLECGGSDPTSGIASNPAVGVASDLLIDRGGTSILSETTELIGAEHILARRAEDEGVASRILEVVSRTEEHARAAGADLRGSQPTPGNIAGGLSTIEEKSLGCIYKAGSAPVRGVLEYAEPVPRGGGLYFMDTPGQDIDSITAMVAGGAQIVVFTTGRGTPTGNPVAPVIKITGNGDTFRSMGEHIDINAGRIIDDGAEVAEVGREIYDMIIAVASGSRTAAEELGHREFGIHRIGYTY